MAQGTTSQDTNAPNRKAQDTKGPDTMAQDTKGQSREVCAEEDECTNVPKHRLVLELKEPVAALGVHAVGEVFAV